MSSGAVQTVATVAYATVRFSKENFQSQSNYLKILLKYIDVILFTFKFSISGFYAIQVKSIVFNLFTYRGIFLSGRTRLKPAVPPEKLPFRPKNGYFQLNA